MSLLGYFLYELSLHSWDKYGMVMDAEGEKTM